MHLYLNPSMFVRVRVIGFNATFNYISLLSALLVEEIGITGKKPQIYRKSQIKLYSVHKPKSNSEL